MEEEAQSGLEEESKAVADVEQVQERTADRAWEPAPEPGVDAESATIRQALVREVNGREIHVVQGAAGAIQAEDVSLVQSAVGLVRADEVSISMGGAGLIVGDRVRVAQGGAQSILARGPVSIEQGGAGVVVAQRVEVHPQTLVGFLVAGNVAGDVRTLFDWRGAVAFGAAFAVASRVLGALRRR